MVLTSVAVLCNHRRFPHGSDHHPRPRPVAKIHGIRNPAHRAVTTPLRHRTEDEGKHKRPERGGVLQ